MSKFLRLSILLNIVALKVSWGYSFCPTNEIEGDPCGHPDLRCGYNGTTTIQSSQRPCFGCVCKPGFLRTEFGECVRPEQCQHCRGRRFEAFMDCGTTCPFVCNEPARVNCPPVCAQGCFCLPGYIRSSRGGPCVPITSCPPRCSNEKTMRFTTCLPACPATCNDSPFKLCPGGCHGVQCECKPGFLRASMHDDECIPRSKCVVTRLPRVRPHLPRHHG